ncbi:MAG TPA: hypothetical protein VGB83_04440 [Actinomycetota bacterium]
MRRAATIAALALAVSASGAQAATTDVTIAGFQYTPSGWLTADPFDASGGAATLALPDEQTALSAPRVGRGDSIRFANMDPVPHTVTKLSGPNGNWTALSLGGGGTATLTIPALFPLGTYVYRCTIHRGMRGSFTVE